jgi:SAM-dependent methyltransferase
VAERQGQREGGEAERIRRAYGRRDTGRDERLYSKLQPAELLFSQGRQRVLASELTRRGVSSLAGLRVLEVGCGNGGVLLELLALGAERECLAGVDLLEHWVTEARARLPGADIRLADATRLPYSSASMDLVLQYTALSSILVADVRAAVAREMLRVVAPTGVIVSYDFVWNPRNRDTRGLGRREIRYLFPDCPIRFRSVTLAPPLARLLAPRSYLACQVLEAVRLLNTHLLAIVSPPSGRR